MIDDLIRAVSCFLIIEQKVMKASRFLIVTADATCIGADIDLIALTIIGDGLSVVVQDRSAARSCEMSECACLAIESIHSTTVCTNPYIMIIVFHHFPNDGKTQVVGIVFGMGELGEMIFGLVNVFDSSIISAYPYTAMPILAKRD